MTRMAAATTGNSQQRRLSQEPNRGPAPSGFRDSGTAILPLARLLAQTSKTGDLHVWRDGSEGILSFQRGRLIAASVADSVGIAALERIELALDGGEFAWS